jgi:hypothetical protein
MQIVFDTPEPKETSGVPKLRESLVDTIRHREMEIKELKELFGGKKDEKKGLTVKQTFWLMICASPVVGWAVSTLLVISLLGMKANIDALGKIIH